MTTDPWPFHQLVLRTPRLELRPDDDAGLRELNEAALAGVHAPDEMPFYVPWTQAPPDVLGRQTMQFYWRHRAEVGPTGWTLNFLVRLDGTVIGTQGLKATNFAVRREVSSGSWITRRLQGQGFGTEIRAAVLHFAFDHSAPMPHGRARSRTIRPRERCHASSATARTAPTRSSDWAAGRLRSGYCCAPRTSSGQAGSWRSKA
jgi:RimJ/RimL family protein N-acetyltransferase